ncbi:MAG: hypothetical protein N2439_08815, partial [Anaerolineae bacterium]|nr:hypothetical protein [Anaerolineae bacterium]
MLSLILIGIPLLLAPTVQSAGQITITGRVFADRNANGVFDNGEAGTPGASVHLYRDLNGNGLVDRNDPRLATAVSESDGRYRLIAAAGGRFVVRLDVRSLPHGERLTTAAQQAVSAPDAYERSVLPEDAPSKVVSSRNAGATADHAAKSLAPVGRDFGHATQEYVQGQVIVGYKPGVPEATIQALIVDALRTTAPAEQPLAARPAVARRIPALHALVLETAEEHSASLMTYLKAS